MEQQLNLTSSCHCQLVSQSGKTVRLEVEQVRDLWLLRIIGSRGQVSEWTQRFGCAIEAVCAGLTALRVEGIDDYDEDPVFSYIELAGQLFGTPAD